MEETWVWSLGWKAPLKKGMAIHSSILVWEISWTEEPGGLQSMGSQKSWTRLNNWTTTTAKCIYLNATLNSSSHFPAVSTDLFSMSVPEHPLLMVHVISLNCNDSWSEYYAHIWECRGERKQLLRVTGLGWCGWVRAVKHKRAMISSWTGMWQRLRVTGP